MKLSWAKHRLKFIRPAGTSRGVMQVRDTWFIRLEKEGRTGLGEAGPLWGLSREKRETFAADVATFCERVNETGTITDTWLTSRPALKFAWETARLDWQTGGQKCLYEGPFTEGRQGIPINGLIWMGETRFLKKQIVARLEEGFTVLKLKVGAVDFATELDVLRYIRTEFGSEIELRLDANGAFQPMTAMEKLKQLAAYRIHSIEQPIAPGQWEAMGILCQQSPIPIALDEELIHLSDEAARRAMLERVKPRYLIFKPTLLGGFQATERWIKLANSRNIGWWVTSALESNIGLNAIAQWTARWVNDKTQGLGTGSLYRNNFRSPLEIVGDRLFHTEREWEDISISLQWH